MSNYRTDKNGFTFRDGEDWNDEKSDQTLKYLTTPKRKFSTVDNSRVIVANNELTTENQLKQKIEKEEAANNLNRIGTRVLTGMIEHGETTADKLMVKYDSTTGLFSNPDRTIAYKNAMDARKWNSSFEPYSETVKTNNAAIKPVKNIGDYYQSKQNVVKKAAAPVKSYSDLNINIDLPTLHSTKIERSAEDIAAEERFREIERKINQEKLDRQTKGLMSFVPLKYYEPK